MTERLNWRHPDYLKKATECDVCKRPWSPEHHLRWFGGTSSVICSRVECGKTMQAWYEDTVRHVEEQLADDAE
jgi:hypothetical protein